jgi:Phosphotransferase enzyme family
MNNDAVSPLERYVLGQGDVAAIRDRLSRYLGRYVGSGISDVLFRAGRIDAVWAVHTDDGRDLVVKAHRQPVDLSVLQANTRAQNLLAGAGFPCPVPVSGPDRFDGLALSTQTLIAAGEPVSGREPGIRRAMAIGLAEHVDVLRSSPDLVSLVGPGPAWCRYQHGPWPTPHDSIFDFSATPADFGWLDSFATAAADRLNQSRPRSPVLVGHADWYCGNLRFDGDRLVAAFDWDLFADTEPVIAGMSAGAYTASGTSGAGLPTPDEVAAFLIDYDTVRPQRFSADEQRTAAAAASWTIAYNARCELAMLTPEADSGPTLELTQRNQNRYLGLTW